MTIYFRVDCNKSIASGHLMRCLSIATEFKKRNCDVKFVVSDDESASHLSNHNYSVINLNSKWDDLEYEIPMLSKYLVKDSESIFIVDSYHITKKYIENLQDFGKVCYLGSKEIYLGEIDAIINYSFDINNDFYNQSYQGHKTKLMLGASFIPIREEFINNNFHISDSINSIFVSTGNTDPQSFTEKILKMIGENCNINRCNVHVVVGSMFQTITDLIKKFQNQSNIVFHQNVRSMSEIMKMCDVAVVANGTTVYELMSLGIPCVTFAVVEEQLNSARMLDHLNLTLYSGPSYEQTECCLARIKNAILNLMNDTDLKKALISRGHSTISGLGCKNIVSNLLLMIMKNA